MSTTRDTSRSGDAGLPRPDETAARTLLRWLEISWWIVLPSFLFLWLALTRDRACVDRYNPLSAIATRPLLAWSVAGTYVCGHAWLAAAYACTILRTGTLLPRLHEARAAWGSAWPKAIAMVGVFLLEYAPVEIWIRLARMTGCGG
jgi:hypothetical protein